MQKCFETVRIENQKIFNIEYHNRRVNKTRKELFGANSDINLLYFIKIPKDNKLYRCKIIYSREIISIEYFEYFPKEFKTFKFININFPYNFKYLKRKNIDKIDRSGCDDFIMVKNSLLTDTSIANIALFNGKKWFTPLKPLLAGTTRERLVKTGFLIEKDLKIDDLRDIKKFAIMNAMVNFKEIENFNFIF